MLKQIQISFFAISLLLVTGFSKNQRNMTANPQQYYSYLALGDSYTIGETVLLADNFPYQTVQLLREKGFSFYAPEIIAKTGWTTDELTNAISQRKTLPSYDFVTLLIGVNNQYRGRTVENFKPEFEALLRQAIRFSGNNKDHVFVLSIPDWGVTPFAEGRNRAQVAREIDAYNNICKQVSMENGVHFIDITPSTRLATKDHSLVAADGLHPSGKEYSKWAADLAGQIGQNISKK